MIVSPWARHTTGDTAVPPNNSMLYAQALDKVDTVAPLAPPYHLHAPY
jgi:hypothetical protein